MISNINNIKISGICGVIPQNTSYFDDEVDNYRHSKESSKKLKSAMGYSQHRVVAKESTITDLIKPAIKDLVDNCGVKIADIDAIIIVTQTPDYLIPATSHLIHGEFEFRNDCYCLDINDGCAGYLKGLYEASSLVKNPNVNKVLLICGDVLSRKVSTSDRNSYPLVGDAITITILDSVYDAITDYPLELKFDGKGALALSIPAGGMYQVPTLNSFKLVEDEDGNLRAPEHLLMKGRDVFTFTQTTVINYLSYFLAEYNNFKIQYMFLHQANLFILDRIRKKLKVDSSILPSDVIEKYGNSSSATVPLSIVEQFKDTECSKVSHHVLLAGFGVGLTWGAAIVLLENLNFCKLLEVEL